MTTECTGLELSEVVGEDERTILLIMIMEIINDLAHLGGRKILWLIREHPSLIHIVDISPHGFKRNSDARIVCNNIRDIHIITITITALMKTETCTKYILEMRKACRVNAHPNTAFQLGYQRSWRTA